MFPVFVCKIKKLGLEQMDVIKLLGSCDDDWVFNSLNIENFNSTSRSRLRHWYNHAREKISSIEGDIFEFGVYKGGLYQWPSF